MSNKDDVFYQITETWITAKGELFYVYGDYTETRKDLEAKTEDVKVLK